MTLVYLKGSRELIHHRLIARHGHLMPTILLDSQFATLEEPSRDEHGVTVSIWRSPEEIVAEIVRQLENREAAGPTMGPHHI